MNSMLHIADATADALKANTGVVALESTIITHGLPWPANADIAFELEEIIREEGATPATIGICQGKITVGMSKQEITDFARAKDEGRMITKVSRRDFASVVAGGLDGATTVAATMIAAQMAGIRIFATGGIGGVHRGAEDSFDISADLLELSKTSLGVVCAGAKSILDIPKTLEVLETNGVPVLGYACDEFPAFHAKTSGLPVDIRLDKVEDIAAILKMRDKLDLAGGEIIANPIPDQDAITKNEMDSWIKTALSDANDQNILGKSVTPFLLSRLADLSNGRSIAANLALIRNNARLAARLAIAYRA